MPISTKIKEFLDDEGVRYGHHVHPTTYTASETAQSIHVPGKEMAKSVIINADGALILAVVPANEKVELHHLQFITRAQNIRLSSEQEFTSAFPSCEIGALPPFGNLFGVATYCDTSLSMNENIEFVAGSHNDTIRMSFEDYKRLAHPVMVDLVDHRRTKLAA